MQPRLIGVICKDAGAANQIAHYISNNSNNYIYALLEPAFSIFKNVLGEVENHELSQVVELADELLTGTGWSSDFEWEGIRGGLKSKKKVVTHLDHWNNFRERFIRNTELILPEEIWVSDEYSMNIAQEQLIETKVIMKEDYFLQYQLDQISKLSTDDLGIRGGNKNRVLFISEPLIDITGCGEFTQVSGIPDLKHEFLSTIYETLSFIPNIRIRPHPSEKSEDFLQYESKKGVSISSEPMLATDLAWADFVVGIDSYALFVADNARIPTASISPWLNREISIPRGNIEFLERCELVGFLGGK